MISLQERIPQRRFRTTRLRYAVTASLGSKLVTATVQLVAMPVAIRALGPEKFVLYAILASAVGWAGAANLGVGPRLTIAIASASAVVDRLKEAHLLTSALVPVATLCLTIAALLPLALLLIPIDKLAGEHYVDQHTTIWVALIVLVAISLLQAILTVVESAQAGYQEQYIANLFAAGGGAVSLGGLLLTAALAPSVMGMILAMSGPSVLARGANALCFFETRRYLRPALRLFDWYWCRTLLADGLAFSCVGIGSFYNHQFSIVLAGRLLDTHSAATFAAVMTMFVLLFGLVSMLGVPLMPAIADSIAQRDIEWIRRTYWRFLSYSMLCALVLGGLWMAGGRLVLRLLYGPVVEPSQALMFECGMYFVLSVWEYVHYVVLIGLNRIRLPAVLYASRSALMAMLGPFCIVRWGAEGALGLLCVTVAALTAGTYAILTRKAIAESALASLDSRVQTHGLECSG
jgi:O-antigen/teichoic acid export membrane protein